MAAPTTRSADRLAQRVVEDLGGRYSTELGIEVDAGEAEVERWFLAATLFGTRISAAVAERTFQVIDAAGLVRVSEARRWSWDQLVVLLDQGGYARYDFRTATRLHALADVVNERYGGRVTSIAEAASTFTQLRDALDALPGWGPVTVGLFLRELRGAWPHADPPLDPRAARAAAHLGLLDVAEPDPLARLDRIARAAHLDVRDLESGLVRLALAHRADIARCPGGPGCLVLARRSGEGVERARSAPPTER